MIDLIIIIILSIVLIGLIGVVIYSQKVQLAEFKHLEMEFKKQEEEREKKLAEKEAYENFEPYLICAIDVEKVYDNDGEVVGQIQPNTFHTIIFEKDGKGQLFSGEGWIDLKNVIRNPVRNMQTPMKVVSSTPLKNGPGLGYKTLGEVKTNEIVEVNDIFGVWYKVRLSNDITGYVYYKNLR